MSSEMRRATWCGVDGRLVLLHARRLGPGAVHDDQPPGTVADLEPGAESDPADD